LFTAIQVLLRCRPIIGSMADASIPLSSPPPGVSIEMLWAKMCALEGKVAVLEAENKALREENRALREKLAAADRSSKRQAAPFSKGKPKANPKKPGRKPGEDYGSHQRRDVPAQVDETVTAQLPENCPACGESLEGAEPTKQDEQFIVDVPVRAYTRRVVIPVAACPRCGTEVRGRHDCQCNDATGAAKVQFGANLHGLMTYLNKQMGLSHGRIAMLMRDQFDLAVSRGTVCRSVLRTAVLCEPIYDEVVAAMHVAKTATGDETGWRLAGLLAWLHGAVSEFGTVYAIAHSRGSEVFAELVGLDFSGLFVHDGWRPYDRFEHATHGACNMHVINRCKKQIEDGEAEEVAFAESIKNLLQTGLKIRDLQEQGEFTPSQIQMVVDSLLKPTLDELAASPGESEMNQKLARHVQRLRDRLFTYLLHPGMPATNYLAEHAMRFAVILRKVWGGNRTPRGAKAQAVLMSVLRTCRQQGLDVAQWLRDVRQGRAPGFILPAGTPTQAAA